MQSPLADVKQQLSLSIFIITSLHISQEGSTKPQASAGCLAQIRQMELEEQQSYELKYTTSTTSGHVSLGPEHT